MKKIVLLLVLVLLLLAGCPQGTNGTAGNGNGGTNNPNNGGNGNGGEVEVAETTISNPYHFVTGIGYYHITGIVENTGNVALKHVRAKITFYTSEGEEKIYDDVIVHPSRLAPGEKGGFDTSIGASTKFKVGEFKAEAGSFSVDDYLPYTEFSIKNIENQDLGGYYKLNAWVENTGQEQAPGYWVNALFYDAAGHVLTTGTDVVLKDGDGLKPGDEKFISFVVAQPNAVDRITDYEILIDFSK
ncbi:FxLYD domain-containing protein [Candidatus Micrarchaeota archaeon]|nr:FxLYD domain-containing protein [Candidatus Micrarchaeota archaeon]MBU2476963.1 FxLYD domain-containing protein [Candidatus Micrarchaeota archaeon]